MALLKLMSITTTTNAQLLIRRLCLHALQGNTEKNQWLNFWGLQIAISGMKSHWEPINWFIPGAAIVHLC